MEKLVQNLAIGYYRTKFRLLFAVSKKKPATIAFELFCTPQLRHKKALPKNFKEAEKLEFILGEHTIRGYRWNKGGTKRVLIAHGFNSSVVKFEQYIGPLVNKGYEVLAFDAPAHGRSTGSMINVVIYRKMILAIIEKYGPITSFMGHSFGGLAISLALEEMPHNPDYRLALIAPVTESKTAIDFFFSFLRVNDSVRNEFDKMVEGVEQRPADWYSASRAVKNINATVRWYHDENDEITLWRDAKKVQEQNYDHIEFVVTKGLGHRNIYRDKKIVRSITEFL